MKKLMTMIAAVAMSFGLFADAYEPQTESFEDGFTVDGTIWSTNAADTVTFEVKDYLTGDEPKHVPDVFADNVGDKYLAVKTELKADGTRGLAYNFSDTDPIGDGVYFDGLVNFATACDETTVDVTVNGGVKLVAYAVDMGEIEGGTAGQTNLFITAGYWNAAANEGQGAWEAKAYNCGPLGIYHNGDATDFYRLTIRAMATIAKTGTVPGFVVFVNELPAQRLDASDGIGYTDLSPEAAAWNSNANRNLFPSLNQDVNSGTMSKILGVTVAGQGLIDCFVLTRTSPECAKDKNFKLTKDEHIESFKYKVGDGAKSDAITESTTSIPLTGEAMTITISDIVYVNNPGQYETWGEGTWTTEDPGYVTPNAAAKTFTIAPNAESCEGTMVSKDVAQRILVDGVAYPTFTEAIAALSTATTKKLTLNADVAADFSNQDGTTEAFFESANDVTLDLAGKTLTSKAGAGSNIYVVMCQCPNFTIMDSAGGGKIVALAGTAGAVAVGNCNLIVEGGTFDGAVTLVPQTTADASIVGGKFLKSANGGTEFTLEDKVVATSKLETVDDYFVVTPLTVWTVTFKKDATDAEAFATTNVVNGETLTLSLIPEPEKDYYTFDGWDYDDAPITEATTILAKWKATEWTITYLDPNEETLDTDTYTIENRSTKTLKKLSYTGYQDCETWFKLVEELSVAVTDLTAETGNLTLYGDWEVAPSTVTITLPQESITGVDSLVVSQLVDSVEWTEVTDGKIGVGNNYVVIAIPAENYLVENPVKSGTAAEDEDITVTAEEVEAKVSPAGFVVKIVKAAGGEQRYNTFAEAIAALAADDTVLLGQNTTFTGDITIGVANVTIDLCGFKLSKTDDADCKVIVNGEGFTMKNGNFFTPRAKVVRFGGNVTGTITYESLVFNSAIATGYNEDKGYPHITADKIVFKGCFWSYNGDTDKTNPYDYLWGMGFDNCRRIEFVSCTNEIVANSFTFSMTDGTAANALYLKDCVIDETAKTKKNDVVYPFSQIRDNGTIVIEGCTFNGKAGSTALGFYNSFAGKAIVKGNTFNVTYAYTGKGRAKPETDPTHMFNDGLNPTLVFGANVAGKDSAGTDVSFEHGVYSTSWPATLTFVSPWDYKNTLDAAFADVDFYAWDDATPIATVDGGVVAYAADLSALADGATYYLKPGCAGVERSGFLSVVKDARALSYTLVEESAKFTFTLNFNKENVGSVGYTVKGGASASCGASGSLIVVDKNAVVTFQPTRAKFDNPFISYSYAVTGEPDVIAVNADEYTINGNGGIITITGKDCKADAGTSAELTDALITNGGADLTPEQEAAVAANVDTIVAAAGSTKTAATWLNDKGYGAHGQAGDHSLYVEDIANAKAMGLTYKLDQTGTEKGFFLFEEEPAATFTAVAASSETAGAMDVAFTLEGAKEADAAAFATLISKRVAEFAKCSLDLADWTATPTVTNASVDENNVVTATIKPEGATDKGFTKIELK